MSIRSQIDGMGRFKAIHFLERTRKEFKKILDFHNEITCPEEEAVFLRDLDLVIEWLQDDTNFERSYDG